MTLFGQGSCKIRYRLKRYKLWEESSINKAFSAFLYESRSGRRGNVYLIQMFTFLKTQQLFFLVHAAAFPLLGYVFARVSRGNFK